MSMDRFDEVTIGHACEVEGCSIVRAPNETRCYDHSVMRYIGTLFNEGEECRFNGVTCTTQATVCNEHEVPMCQECHHAYVRIQMGRGLSNTFARASLARRGITPSLTSHPFFGSGGNPYFGSGGNMPQSQGPDLLPPNHRWPQRPRHVTGNQQSMGSTYDGGSYQRGIDWAALMEGEQEEVLGEEDCTCNNLDHSQFNEECPLNEDPPLPTIGHAIRSGGLIGIFGIPPMRRDEGEETE